MYLQNKPFLNEKVQKNTIRIIVILFTKTKHNGHFEKEQSGSKRKFMAAQNFKLSLIVLTWLCPSAVLSSSQNFKFRKWRLEQI
jgi:hypothetical protein